MYHTSLSFSNKPLDRFSHKFLSSVTDQNWSACSTFILSKHT